MPNIISQYSSISPLEIYFSQRPVSFLPGGVPKLKSKNFLVTFGRRDYYIFWPEASVDGGSALLQKFILHKTVHERGFTHGCIPYQDDFFVDNLSISP